VPDRIAGEAGKRGRPIRHVLPADRAQRKQVIERQGEIPSCHIQRCKREVAPVGRGQRIQHLAGIDGAQNAIEHDSCGRDNGQADRDPDPVPADARVAENRDPMQCLKHPALARGFRLRRSVHQARVHPSFRAEPGIH